MFAYGVEGLCEKSDLVTGPGNIYVAAAKRSLRGVIGIDSEAGPTEIAILADSSARASDVAADLISQAEHDVIAAGILVTDSIDLANNVEAELKIQIERTKHKERIKAALSGIQSAIVIVDDMKQGIDVVNAYAAEHLEIQTKNSREDAAQIRNAGAVFIGRFHLSHLEITRQDLIMSFQQGDVLVTQVDYLFRHFFVDFTSLNMAKKHSLI